MITGLSHKLFEQLGYEYDGTCIVQLLFFDEISQNLHLLLQTFAIVGEQHGNFLLVEPVCLGKLIILKQAGVESKLGR